MMWVIRFFTSSFCKNKFWSDKYSIWKYRIHEKFSKKKVTFILKVLLVHDDFRLGTKTTLFRGCLRSLSAWAILGDHHGLLHVCMIFQVHQFFNHAGDCGIKVWIFPNMGWESQNRRAGEFCANLHTICFYKKYLLVVCTNFQL